MNGSTKETSPVNITILHFNDCYNIEPRTIEPAGGAARFKKALESFSESKPLVFFSGDILGPSISKFYILISTLTIQILFI